MDLGIKGKVAVVAGASKGLGRGVAVALADEGVSLVINARDASQLDETAEAISRRGAQVHAIAADVTEADTPTALVAAAIERFGRVDIVVPNSGGPAAKRALEVEDEEVLAAVESNLLTHVRFVRAALPHLREQGWGRICSIASYGIVQPLPNLALSNLARTGLRAWAKTAAHDLIGSGVTLNLVAPGLHRTDRVLALGTATGELGDPDDFGRIVAFLCSAHAGFINGTTIVVDGAETVAL